MSTLFTEQYHSGAVRLWRLDQRKSHGITGARVEKIQFTVEETKSGPWSEIRKTEEDCTLLWCLKAPRPQCEGILLDALQSQKLYITRNFLREERVDRVYNVNFTAREKNLSGSQHTIQGIWFKSFRRENLCHTTEMSKVRESNYARWQFMIGSYNW